MISRGWLGLSELPDLLTNKEAATVLCRHNPGLDIDKAEARVSAAGGRGAFRTTGGKGASKRIEKESFAVWLLDLQEAELRRLDQDDQRSERERR